MALFRYKALSTAGETLEGQMEAASADDVVARLQEQGHLPVEARRADEAGGGASLSGLLRRRELDEAQVLQFTQQLATLLGAGQPLDRALGILLELPDTVQARRVIERIREAVRGGAPLSTALEQQHGLFSRLYVNLVRAGEAGGNVHEALRRLADYLERSQALRSRVANALLYPAILLLVVGAAILFLLGYVTPQFAQMYSSLDVPLPWFTRMVLALGAFVSTWWLLLLAVPALALLWAGRRWRDPAARQRLDGWLLRRRMVGEFVARLETSRLARTLGTLLRNGVPMLAALKISGAVVGNQVMAGDVARAAEEVRNGRALSEALAQGRRFPRLALQMVQVGEESGALDAMLLKTADMFEQQTAQALDRMLALLVPGLTLALAVVVGGVILAVLVPLYDLSGAIQ